MSEGRHVDEAPLGLGSVFDLVARLQARGVSLHYLRIVVVRHGGSCWARRGFVSKDTITVEPMRRRVERHYDATLAFRGLGRLLDPVMQRVFDRVGARATLGLQTALNP